MSSPKDRPTLSLTQISASALAASSAAFAASYLGVAGTIIGAAVASVIATVATATYSASLQRSREAVRRATLLASRNGVPAPSRTLVPDPHAPVRDSAAEDLDVTGTRELVIVPEPRSTSRPGWRWTAGTAVAGLVLSLGTLTAVEGVLGKPLSALLGGSDATGTTVGSTVTGGSGSTSDDQRRERVPETPAEETETPSPTPTPTPTPTSEPTDEPTAEPTDEPTDEPTSEPTPTDEPTADPTPTPTP